MFTFDTIRKYALVFAAFAAIIPAVFYGYRAFNYVWGLVLGSFDRVATQHGQPWLAITISLTVVSVLGGLLLAMATLTKPVEDETRLSNAMQAIAIWLVVAVIVTGLITLVWWCWQHIVWNDELFAEPWDGVYVTSIWPFSITAGVVGLLAYAHHRLWQGWEPAHNSQPSQAHDTDEIQDDEVARTDIVVYDHRRVL